MRLVPTRRRLLSGICTLVVIGGLLLVIAPPAWAISTNPASLDFGKVRTGATKTLDVMVTISSGFQFFSITRAGTITSSTTVNAAACAGFVGPGDCLVRFSFSPVVSGVRSGLFSFTECSTSAPVCNGTPPGNLTGEGVLNAAPVCQDVSATVSAGSTGGFNLSCTDTDTITYSVLSSPQHGTATLTPGTGAVTYVPDAGYIGPDSFTYQADDGAYPPSNVATANILVTSPHPPQPHPGPAPTPTPTERFQLNLSKVGHGRIVSDPAGINCGNDCTGDFDEGAQVTLTAKARAGWEFMRWRYRCRGQGKVCTIEMMSNRAAMAVFVRPPIVREGRGRS